MKKVFLIAALMFSVLTLQANDVFALKVDTTQNKVTPKSIEAAFDAAGFVVQSNNDLSGVFREKFQMDAFDAYHLLALYYPDTVKEIVDDSVNAALFEPFTIVLYQRKGSPYLHAAMLNVKARSHLTGSNNANEAIAQLTAKTEATLQQAMVNAQPYTVNMKLEVVTDGDVVTQITRDVKDDDYEAYKDNFDEAFEVNLDGIGFFMANYLDLSGDVGDEYLFFDVYSLCKISILVGMVDKMPEAGVLAPCAVAVYQKAGSNTFTVEYANVRNWIQTFQIQDQEGKDFLLNVDKQITHVITESLDAKTE